MINPLYNNKNAVIYCRVSTQKQVEDGESLLHQEHICRKWCEKQNMKIIKTAKGEYSFKDEGITGGKAEVDEENTYQQKFIDAMDPICKKIPGIHHRPGLIAALKACKKGYVFVTYALTRLSRNATQSLVISEYLESKKIHLVCIQDNIEINGENKEEQSVKIHIQSLFSHMEHNAIKKRTKASLQYLKEQGRYLGRIRYGYKLENGQRFDDLVEDPEEQKVIQMMKDMRGNVKNRHGREVSYKDIARFLNHEGYRTRSGKPWCHSQVELLIKAPPPNMKGNPKKRAKNGTAKKEELDEDENIDSPRVHQQFQKLVKEELGGELIEIQQSSESAKPTTTKENLKTQTEPVIAAQQEIIKNKLPPAQSIQAVSKQIDVVEEDDEEEYYLTKIKLMDMQKKKKNLTDDEEEDYLITKMKLMEIKRNKKAKEKNGN